MSTAPDIDTLKRLIGQQLPELAGKPFSRVRAAGTDNLIFRIGESHCLRVPRGHEGIPSLAYREPAAMRNLKDLPLQTPQLVDHGLTDTPQGWPWLVCTWLAGDSAETGGHALTEMDARRLALFLLDLQGQKRDFAAEPNIDNHWRGCPLSHRDSPTRSAIGEVAEDFDVIALAAIWNAALEAPPCPERDRTWIHGDLHAGNLLVREGELSGVIDWGLSGLGDPACDLMAGFTLFEGAVQEVFWQASGITETVWRRARGWALSTGVIAYAHYRGTKTPIEKRSRKLLEELSFSV